MKAKNLIPLLLTTLLTASCAELNTALESANQALGTLNGTMSGGTSNNTASSDAGSKTIIPLVNKSTAQFETRNMQLEVRKDGCWPSGGDMLSLTGEVRNKTNKSFTFIYSIPTYTPSGARAGSIGNFTMISPNEWTALTTIPSCAEKYDASKLELKTSRL